MRGCRTIAILAVPGVQLLDVAGPVDVFAEANLQAGRQAYRLQVIATGAGDIHSSSGLRLVPDLLAGATVPDAVDTLLVAGAPHAGDADPDPATLDWLRRAVPLARRYGSVCSGAFLLAAAGLLEGRRVTTHWAVADRLARAYPGVTVDTDAIHVRDGRLRTAAGVTAGLDLALSLVEEDLGHEVAMRVASQLVMLFRRVGGQAQFSRNSRPAPLGRSVLQEVQRWAAANPAADLRVPALATRAGLSPRHFARLFRHEVGTTPAAWTEQARIAAARRLLEARKGAPKQVAAACGFADANTLRRAFLRHVGITPAEYRKRFGPAIDRQAGADD